MMEMILSTDCKNSLRPAALLKKRKPGTGVFP